MSIPLRLTVSRIFCLLTTTALALGQDRSTSAVVLFPFQNPNLPLEQRISDLASRMTLDEKVSQMLFNAPSINRLGIPDYWCGEALQAAERIPTIMTAWYPGQVAGLAIADVLFGNYSPDGRLPVTFYKAANELPPFATTVWRVERTATFEENPCSRLSMG